MTIERAILLVVGIVVLGSVLLAVYVSPKWLWLTGLMGAHLIQGVIHRHVPGGEGLEADGLAVATRVWIAGAAFWTFMRARR